jgi:hypothetical protein
MTDTMSSLLRKQVRARYLLRLLLMTTTYTGMAGLAIKGWAADFPFRAGEKLTYRISWSRFLEAGSVELLATQAGPSTPGTFRLQLKATTTPVVSGIYPFKDEFASLFDPVLGLPSHFEKNFVERKRIVRETVDFDHFGQTAYVFTPGKPRQKLPVEWGTQDPLSALYLIRGLTLKPGLQISFPVLDGGKIYRVDLQVAGSDLISTQDGSFPAQRLEVRLYHRAALLNDKRLTLWVSSDDRKLPVLVAVNLSFGSALIELISRSN